MKLAIEDLNRRIGQYLEGLGEIATEVVDYFSKLEVQKSGTFGSKQEWVWTGNSRHQLRKIAGDYRQWHNGVLPLVEEYLPHEVDSFNTAKDKFIEFLSLNDEMPKNPERLQNWTIDVLSAQEAVLRSIPASEYSKRLINPRRLSRSLVSEEIAKAQEFLEQDHYRAAGALAGVGLERHLVVMAETASEDVDFSPADNITELAQGLYEADVIDSTDHDLVKFLARVRNRCTHDDPDGINSDQVKAMVEQTDDFIERHS